MAADGQIVLGLDISETKSQIESDLSTVLGTVKAKQLIIKTAIDKQETEKTVNRVVKELGEKTAKVGLKIDSRDVTTVLNQQTKITEKQSELNRKMKEYQDLAQRAGLTLKQVNLDKFSNAIKLEDFEAARESIRAVKKEIDQFNVSVDKMYGDTKIYFDIESTVKQFDQLKEKSKDAVDMLSQLKDAQRLFDDTNVGTQDKLRVYENIKSILGELDLEYKRIKTSEDAIAKDNELTKHIEDARTMLKNLDTTFTSLGDGDAASKLSKSIENLRTAFGNTTDGANGVQLANDWENVSAAIDAAKRALSEYRAEQSGLTKQTSAVNSMIEKLKEMSSFKMPQSNYTDDLRKRIADAKLDAENLREILLNLNPSDQDAMATMETSLESLRQKFRELRKEAKPFESTDSWDKFQQKIDRARKSVEEYDQKYSAIKGNPELVRQLEQLREDANKIASETDLSKFNHDFAEFDKTVQQAGLHTKSLSDRFKEAFKNFSYFFSASRLIYEVVSDVKQMVVNVKELDSAMVELRKVTEATDAEFKQFFADAKEDAVELGTTVKDLINATSQFSRLGYTLPEAQELGRVAAMYQNVGDDVTSIDQASKSLVSTMKGFHMEAEDSMSIIDKFNEVGNRFAISSGGIGDALQRSAAAMFAANNTIDESIALIVAANNVIQDPDMVGNMWKTVSMRIRGATAELQQAGLETDGMAKSTANLRDTVMQLTNVNGTGGFDIMMDEDTFKSTYDIILGIGQVWKDISDVDQAALLELLAGKRQGNALAAALTNLDDLQKALVTAGESAGSAQREYEVWLTSLEAKINQFKAAFEVLSDTVVNSDLIKGAVDFGTDVLQLLNDIIERFGGLGNTLLAMATVIASLKLPATIALMSSLSEKVAFFVALKGESIFNSSFVKGIQATQAGLTALVTKSEAAKSAFTMLGGAASVASFGFTVLSVALIAIVNAYRKAQQEAEETRRKSLETANAALEEGNAFQSAYIKFKQYSDKTELTQAEEAEFKTAIDEVNKSLEYRAELLGLNTKNTEDYAEAVEKAAKQEFESAVRNAKQAQQAAKELLKSDAYSNFSGSLITLDLSGRTGIQQFQDALKTVREYMSDYLDEGVHGLELEPINWDIDARSDNAIDSVVDYYYKLLDVRDALTDLDQMDNDIYRGIVKIIGSVEDDIRAYEQATLDVLKNSQYLENGIPTTVEEFKQFRQDLIDTMTEGTQIDASDNSNFIDWLDGQLFGDDTYARFAAEIANESRIADQVVINRQKIVDELEKLELSGMDWSSKFLPLQQYKEFVDGLSPKELETALSLLQKGAITGFQGLQTAMESLSVPKLISGSELSNLREFYDELQTLNAQAEMLGVNLEQTVYGNIDTNNRQLLEWTDENIERFKKEIESWGMIPEELAGTVSTVLGSFDKFNGIDIAYTPILNTDNGAELLSKDTVFRYFEALAESAGEGWTDEDFLRLDAKGMEIDGRKIKGLIAGIGKEAERASYSMHFTGNVGAIANDMKELQDAADAAGVSIEALMLYLENMTTRYASSAESIRNALSNLWSSEDFKTTRQEIEKLANVAGGVTVDAIEKLADSSEVFRNILDQEGMNAEFLARVLTQLGKGNYDGLKIVTEDALRLNDALMGLEDSFGGVTTAKNKFDAAMKAGEKDDNFKSYAEAFQKLNDEFAAGTVNSNAFWAAAEYLFGNDQLAVWGWADGLDEIYNAMKRNVDVFKDANSSGAGFLKRLYEISENGKILDNEGNVLAEIAKLSDGSYDFNIDASNLDALGEKMGLTREAIVACIQAISMFGEVNLYDINEVIDALMGASLAFDTLSGTAVNIDGFIDQLTTLGKSDKEINDLLKTLQNVDGITFISASGEVDELKNSLDRLGLAVHDGDMFNINVTGLSVLMQQLQFTKEEAESVINKLSETDNVSLQNANGEIIALSDALSELENKDFSTVKADVDGIAGALGGVNDTETEDAEDSLYGIRDAADLAKKEIEQLQTKIDGLRGKEVTISVNVERKHSLLSMLGFAKGTDNAPETDAVVGEKGEELIVGDGRAYIAGSDGAEIVHLNKGDMVYTAEETAKIKRNSKILGGSIPAYYDGRATGKISSNSSYSAVIPTSGSKSKSSSSSKSETEFERLYKYHQHLLNMEQESVEDYLNWLDAAYQSAYKKGEIELDDFYKYQEEVFNKYRELLDTVRKEHENAITLNQNWLDQAIANGNFDGVRKYTSDIIAHYRAMQDELHTQAEYYRSLGYSDTSDEVSKLSDLWWDYYDEIKNASANAWAQIVDNANDAVDAVQGVYDTLHEAAVEYNESSYITVDTLQKILSWGVEYLEYLKDENGQLAINEKSVQDIIKARTEQMAVETALQYVESLRTAILDGNTNALNRLLFATQQSTTATWGLIDAQLQSLGLNDQQYAAASQKINAIYSLTQVAIQSVGQIDGKLKDSLNKTKDSLEDILKYVEDMIKQEVETKVDALEKQVKSYKEIVDLQKKSLDLERERDDYTKSVAEKTKELGELQAQIALLDQDKSREAQAQKIQLVERYAELQAELADTQADYAYDTTVNALDDMYEAYSKSKSEEIETVKNTVSSEEKLYQLAISRINDNWDTLYRDLIAWNTEYGSDTNAKLTTAWNNASLAVQQYGSYLNSVAAIQSRINAMDSSSSSYVSPTVVAPSSGVKASVTDKVSKMKQNSSAWYTNVNDRTNLETANKNLAEQISKEIGQKVEIKDGTWYVGNKKLYDLYPTYHSGTSSVGGKGTLKQNETFAKLEDGEMVLPEKKQNGIFRVLDFSETLFAKYGDLAALAENSDMSLARMQEQIQRDAKSVQNVDNNRNDMTINVPVQIYPAQKLDDGEIKQLSRRIGKDTIAAINNEFFKSGKRTGLPILKP